MWIIDDKEHKTQWRRQNHLFGYKLRNVKGNAGQNLHYALHTKAKGMGFGLPISKRLAEAHGGSLSFESTIGKGTTPTISIQTKPKAETKDEIWVELPTPTTTSQY